MALRALQGPTGGGAPVGGTGATNTIPRWTGPSTLGDSGLIDNGTAIYTTARDRFGIGIATPDQGLHVLSPNNATTSGGQVTQQNFNGVSNQKWMTSVGGGDNVWVSGRGWFLRDMTAGATRLVCDTSGNVGIGTTSPGALLDVNTGTALVSYVTSTRLSQTGTAANSGQRILFHNSAQAWDQGAIGSLREGANNNFALTFFTSIAGTNTERARIDSNGNLVVGLSASASASTNRLQLANNSTAKQGIEFRPGVAIGGGTGNEIVNYDRNLSTYLGTEWSSSFFRLSLTGSYFEASTNGAGLKLQGTAGTNNTDPNVLDFYADGGTTNSGGVTWTPTLRFGGATTGITYSAQVGRYTRIGNMIHATGVIALTSKGSATGSVSIAGLPTSANLTDLNSSITIGYLSNITFGGQATGWIPPNSGTITLMKSTSGTTPIVMQDTDFAATSTIFFSVSYPVT